MASKKISELTSATTPLGPSDLVEVVQGGVNKKAPKSAFGLQSVQAGTNVTIDDTDPSNPIINASGGDSGTVESVTGDGVDNTDPANPVISYPDPSDIGLGNVDNTSDTNKPVSTATQTALNLKLDSIASYRTVTSTHELDATDLASVNAGDQLVISLDSASPLTLEIPTNAVRAFPQGTIISGMQYGVGQVTISPDVGVTMRSPNNANKTFAQYSKFYIEKNRQR